MTILIISKIISTSNETTYCENEIKKNRLHPTVSKEFRPKEMVEIRRKIFTNFDRYKYSLDRHPVKNQYAGEP